MNKIEKYLLTCGFTPKYPTKAYMLSYVSPTGKDRIQVGNYGRKYEAEYTVFYTDDTATTMYYSSTKAADIIAWIQSK